MFNQSFRLPKTILSEYLEKRSLFSSVRRRKGKSVATEQLEPRVLLTVSPEEQLFVYALNRARNSPVAYQQENNLSVDLSYVQAQPPLAVNDKLFVSSEVHAIDLATNNYFAHYSPFLKKWPNKLARDAGYALPSWFPNDGQYGNAIESLAAAISDPTSVLNQLIVDDGVDPPGHRDHLFGIGDFYSPNPEIGVGHEFNASSDFRDYWAIHATHTDTDIAFLTGVVYNDSNRNQRFDLNEGLAGVTVTAGSYLAVTNAAGGWSIAVPNGSYLVQSSGGAYAGISQVATTVNGSNVEVDFVSGVATGYVDFSLFQSSGPTAINLSKSEVAENLPAGTFVGVLSAAYPTSGSAATADASIRFTLASAANNTTAFTLVSGTGSGGNGSFTIAGNVLKTAASFDYEVRKTYSIRVRATGNTGQFFERQFTIGVKNVVEGIIINSPASTTVDQHPLISWTPVSGAQSYDVWISRVPGTAALVQKTVTNSSFTPTEKLGVGKYNLWVRATVGGVRQRWSEVYSFAVNSPIVLNSLLQSQATVRPMISWIALAGAAKYDVWIDDTSRHVSQAVRAENVVATTFTPSVDLPIGQYSVWVRGIASDGTLGKWSRPAMFRTLQPPILQQSASSTFDRTPTFTWGSVPGAVKYEFFLRNLATAATTHNEKNLTATSFTPNTNLARGSYRWWAIAVSEAGIRTLWSAPADLSIGGRTSLLTPKGTVTTSKPVFTWNAVAASARYDLYVSQIGGTAQIIRQENLTQPTFTPTTALPAGAYRAWIRAISTSDELGPVECVRVFPSLIENHVLRRGELEQP